MKIILSLFAVILFSSCAHQSKYVSEKADSFDYKNHELLKEKVEVILKGHPEFNEDTKVKLKKVIFAALEKNKEIKVKESKIAQLLLTVTLKDKASFDEISKVKKAMKAVYMDKYKVFEKTANDLRDILDIKRQNVAFINEIEPYLHR